MSSHRLAAYKYLLLVSMIWGVAGPVIKFTLTELPPLVFLTYRFFISTIIALFVFAKKRPAFPKSTSGKEKVAVYGFLTSTVGLGLLFLGYEKTTAISGTLLSAMSPMLVAAAGAYFLHDHITKREHLGIGIAFAGTMLTVVEPLLTGQHAVFSTSLEGNLLVVGSILAGVVTVILGKFLLRDHIEPDTLAHISFIIGFVTMLPILITTYQPHEVWQILTHASLSSHLGVVYMSILSGTLAYTLWHKGQKMIEVSEANLFSYLLPLWATPVAVIWLGEKLTPLVVFGGLVIALGVCIAEYKKGTRLQKHIQPAHLPHRKAS